MTLLESIESVLNILQRPAQEAAVVHGAQFDALIRINERQMDMLRQSHEQVVTLAGHVGALAAQVMAKGGKVNRPAPSPLPQRDLWPEPDDGNGQAPATVREPLEV